MQVWAERWHQLVEAHQARTAEETPREFLARIHADFLARAPVREVVERFVEMSPVVFDLAVWRVRLSCGHEQSCTDKPAIRCVHCWEEM